MQGAEVLAPVSVGELVDKITILEIKAERIRDPHKLEHIHAELEMLRTTCERLDCDAVKELCLRLRSVNEALWDIEDELRRCEAERRFDDRSVALARSVYFKNDERAAIKRQINERLGSRLVEEKSYAGYEPADVSSLR